MAFAYYTPYNINSAQVPSTQSNFPVLVNVTDARFKTVGNGGHVQNANGYDIRPYTDGTLSSAISNYELERYNASTGELIMWVKVSSVSSSTTPFVLAYGDSGISTDGSSGVGTFATQTYHLKDGTTLSVLDARGAFNGTNNGATATSGQIDGGAAFVAASSQYISTANTGTWAENVDTTITFWFKTSANSQILIGKNSNTGAGGWYFLTQPTGKLSLQVKNSGGTVTLSRDSSTTINDNAWRHAAAVFHINTSGSSGQDIQMYINGASDQGTLTNTGASADDGAGGLLFARRNVGASPLYFTGSLDEIRVWKSTALTADWIATEYNNQGAPATFATLGSEIPVGTGSSNFFLLFR